MQILGGYGGDAIASYSLYLLNIVSLQISDEPFNFCNYKYNIDGKKLLQNEK